MRSGMGLMAVLALTAAHGAELANWRMGVSFDERDASFAVTDRASGRVWRSNAALARETFAVSDVRVEGGDTILFRLATPKAAVRTYDVRLTLEGSEVEVTVDGTGTLKVLLDGAVFKSLTAAEKADCVKRLRKIGYR